MRIAVRALVAVAVPMLAFGCLTRAQLIQPPADPAETILVFLLPDRCRWPVQRVSPCTRSTPTPVPLAPLTVTVLAAIALVV